MSYRNSWQHLHTELRTSIDDPIAIGDHTLFIRRRWILDQKLIESL